MAAYGAVGRFSVAGWRDDFRLVSFASAALILGTAAYQAGSGTVIYFSPAGITLGEAAYQPSAGARVDATVGGELVLSGLATVAETGASVATVPSSLVLDSLPTQVLTGATAQLIPDSIVLGEATYQPLTGVALSFAVSALTLDPSVIYAGAGTLIDVVPGEPLVVGGNAYDPQVGAAVQYAPWSIDSYRLSTVGAWCVAGGPSAFVRRVPRLSAVALQPLTGATVKLGTAEITLDEVSYEIGARKKAIRGQFLNYS